MKIHFAALAACFCFVPLAQADSIYSIRGLATGTLASQAFKGWVTINLIPDAGVDFPVFSNAPTGYNPTYATIPVIADVYTESPQSETQFLNQSATVETDGSFIVSVTWDGISLDASALGYNPYWQSSSSSAPIPLYVGSLVLSQFNYGGLTVYPEDPIATPEPISAVLLPLGGLFFAAMSARKRS